MKTEEKELRRVFRQASNFVNQCDWTRNLPASFLTSFTSVEVGAVAFELRIESSSREISMVLETTYADAKTAKTNLGTLSSTGSSSDVDKKLSELGVLGQWLADHKRLHSGNSNRPSLISEHSRSHNDAWFELFGSKLLFRKTTNGAVLFKRYGSEVEQEISPVDDRYMVAKSTPISEEAYWKKRVFDAVFGVEKTLSVRVEMTEKEPDISNQMRLKKFGNFEPSFGQSQAQVNPVYYDGFSEKMAQCSRSLSDNEVEISNLFKVVFRLAETEETRFGGLWIGDRPSIVWDDTGIYVITDDDLSGRKVGYLLFDRLSEMRTRYRKVERDERRYVDKIQTRADEVSSWKRNSPSPRRRLVQEVDWVEIPKPSRERSRYLNRQESVDAVREVVERKPGSSIYAIDAALNAARLHQALRLPEVLDQLEAVGEVQTKPGKKCLLYFPNEKR